MSFESNVSSELDEDCRLVVSVRETLTPMAYSHPSDVFRAMIASLDLSPQADVEVLAIMAQPVTPGCCYREYFRPWHVVDNWLLLYRVHMSRDHLAVN